MIETTKDGRTIRTGKDFSDFRRYVFNLQGGLCTVCPRRMDLFAPLEYDNAAHLAHRGSRGMGSSFRDDVLGPKRGQCEGIKCGKCHRQEHHQ